jgi:hypothetical protein
MVVISQTHCSMLLRDKMTGERARLNQFSSVQFSPLFEARPVTSPILCLIYEQVSKREISTHRVPWPPDEMEFPNCEWIGRAV